MVVSAKKVTLGERSKPRAKKYVSKAPVTVAPVAFIATGPVFPLRPVAQALSPRSKHILDYIEANPGFTVLEYSDKITEDTSMISSVLLHTQIGQWLGATGQIAITDTGGRPKWFHKLPDEYKPNVPLRAPQAQLSMPMLANIEGIIGEAWGDFGKAIVNLLCKNIYSPNVRLKRLNEMAEHIAAGMQREIEAQEKIVALQTASPILALAAPAPEVKALSKKAVRKAVTPKVAKVAKVAKTAKVAKSTSKKAA